MVKPYTTKAHNCGSTFCGCNDTSVYWQQWNMQEEVRLMRIAVTSAATNQLTWKSWNNHLTIQMTNSGTTSAEWYTPGIVATGSNAQVYLDAVNSWERWNCDAHGRLLTREERIARETEEMRRYEEQQREYQLRRAAELEAAQKADARAEKLLLEHLNPEQREQYNKHKHFYLYSGGKKYRVDKAWSGHVKLVDEKTNEPIEQLCVHPVEKIPDADNMLIAKLNLEADPETYRKIANITRLRRAV